MPLLGLHTRLELGGQAEDVGVVLGEAAHPHQPVQGTGPLIPATHNSIVGNMSTSEALESACRGCRYHKLAQPHPNDLTNGAYTAN